MQKIAIRDLNITWQAFQEKTIFELTVELEGYNGRWEEHWRPFRKLCTLLFNVNVSAEDRLEEYQYMPFPSDMAQIEMDDYINSMKFEQIVTKPTNTGYGST